MLSITIDIPKGVGGYLDSFWAIVERNKKPVEDKIKKLLRATAKRGHRSFRGKHYENETGRLQQSTKAVGKFSRSAYDDQIRLYVDTTQADYAKYVIGGHGSWDGDPFIDEAMQANKAEITKLIKNLYNDAIREWNGM